MVDVAIECCDWACTNIAAWLVSSDVCKHAVCASVHKHHISIVVQSFQAT